MARKSKVEQPPVTVALSASTRASFCGPRSNSRTRNASETVKVPNREGLRPLKALLEVPLRTLEAMQVVQPVEPRNVVVEVAALCLVVKTRNNFCRSSTT